MTTIMVVDDDKNIRKLMSAVLEKEGYSVILASSGEEALDSLNKDIDLVILDIMMPSLNGYETTEAIRSTNKNLPIIMVSAKFLPEDKKMGFIKGIDDYMTKPIDPEELILRIKAILRRSKKESDNTLVIGSVVINKEELSVKRGEETVTLPQKEFLLLYKLLSSPGRIFTRIQLMDEIWGEDSQTGWETVTVHIARLRKRFENYKEFEIVAIRELGYKAEIRG